MNAMSAEIRAGLFRFVLQNKERTCKTISALQKKASGVVRKIDVRMPKSGRIRSNNKYSLENVGDNSISSLKKLIEMKKLREEELRSASNDANTIPDVKKSDQKRAQQTEKQNAEVENQALDPIEFVCQAMEELGFTKPSKYTMGRRRKITDDFLKKYQNDVASAVKDADKLVKMHAYSGCIQFTPDQLEEKFSQIKAILKVIEDFKSSINDDKKNEILNNATCFLENYQKDLVRKIKQSKNEIELDNEIAMILKKSKKLGLDSRQGGSLS
jgi:hypothetical protein